MATRKDVEGAIKVLDEGQRAFPQDDSLPAAQAEWLLKSGQLDQAIAAYESILKRAPGNRAAANNLAVLLSERKGDDESLGRALRIASAFEGSSQSGELDTLGMVHYRMGNFDKALSALQRAADSAPQDAVVQLHLGMALLKGGEPQRGAAVVRKALSSKAALPNVEEAKSLIARR
jgi:Flp pilus assembly protein TadD